MFFENEITAVVNIAFWINADYSNNRFKSARFIIIKMKL
jgi:hypothetical protein